MASDGRAGYWDEPHPLNAPGPFYTARDQCIACHAPEAEAPGLMAFDEAAGTCYFRCQPATPAEVDLAVNAVSVACCDALHYDGDDPAVLVRFARLPPELRRPAPWPRGRVAPSRPEA